MQRNEKRNAIGVIVIFIVVSVVGVGYIKLKEAVRWGGEREAGVEPTTETVGNAEVKKEAEDRSQPNTSKSKQVTDTSDWKVYRNEEAGISFKYPPKYCVGFFSKDDLGDNDALQYYIKIAAAHYAEQEDYKQKNPGIRVVSPCEVAFLPGEEDMLSIQIFQNTEKSVQGRSSNGFKRFTLSPIKIDDIIAQRSFVGEGLPNKGARRYEIVFQKGEFAYSLFTYVDCSATSGTCEPPRDEAFIKMVDGIVKTIHLID